MSKLYKRLLIIGIAVVLTLTCFVPKIRYDIEHQMPRNPKWVEGQYLQNVVFTLGCEIDEDGRVWSTDEYSVVICYSGSNSGYESMVRGITNYGVNLFGKNFSDGIKIPEKLISADNKEILLRISSNISRDDVWTCYATEEHGVCVVLFQDFSFEEDKICIYSW